MFSLIISVIAVILVVAIALATLYYGGQAFNNSSSKATAATLINQASQIEAAASISESQGNAWPANFSALAPTYLASLPMPPPNAYAEGTPVSGDWAYYIPGQSHHIVLENKIRKDVCLAINRAQGLVGIPGTWDGTSLIQCFGMGTAAANGDLAYTFMYTPNGATADQQLAALTKSVTDTNAALAASPVQALQADGSLDPATPVGYAMPGYPVLCPSGHYIIRGACIDSSGPDTAGTPAPSSAAFRCVNSYIYIDSNGFTMSDGTTRDMGVVIVGEGARAEFSGISIPRDVASSYPYLTGQIGSTSDSQVWVNLTPGPHAVSDNAPYIFTGATGKTVTCPQEVIQSWNPAANQLVFNIADGPRDVAGGYGLDLLAIEGTFVLGPNGQKPLVYWFDKLMPDTNVTLVNSTTLHIANIPSFAEAGGYSASEYNTVMVQNYGSDNAPGTEFVYSNPPPNPVEATPPTDAPVVPTPPADTPFVVTSVSPAQGPATGGTLVTLTGSGFLGTETVTINGIPETVVSVSPTEIKIITSNAADNYGYATLYVTHPNPDPNISGNVPPAMSEFDYTVPELAANSYAPTAGGQAGGDLFSLQGPHLTADTEVYFDSQRANFISFDGNQLLMSTPPHAPGTATVTVITRDGNYTTAFQDPFTFQ